jgi:elongator complex protein 1
VASVPGRVLAAVCVTDAGPCGVPGTAAAADGGGNGDDEDDDFDDGDADEDADGSSSSTGEDLLIELDDGRLWRWTPPQGPALRPVSAWPALSPPCATLAVARMGPSRRSLALWALAASGQLLLNGRAAAAHVGSLALHSAFALAATHSHQLRCLPLVLRPAALLQALGDDSALAPAATGSGKRAAAFDEAVRAVERGSRLVAAAPGGSAVVLQMPRGNLETVHPRALVLADVRAQLAAGAFASAFVACRRHRVNLNVLCDHDPRQFAARAADFVRALAAPAHLNLFLADLRDDDVTATLYRGGLAAVAAAATATAGGTSADATVPDAPWTAATKVNTVCDLVIAAAEAVDPAHYLHSVLLALTRKTPSRLDAALLRVKTLRAAGAVDVARGALQFLAVLVKDANILCV